MPRRYKGGVIHGDTIYALASGRPPAGVAVVRLSGPEAIAAAERLAGRRLPRRRATLAALRDEGGGLLDRALLLAFPAPASFTGEDVAELHLHGGAAVIAAVLAALDTAGLRLAEPGEFSRRAFDSGKLDLTEAEGLADLIAAETEAQRRQALAQAGGRLRDRAEDWRQRLLALRAEAESDLDFADEADVAEAANDRAALAALAAEIGAALADDGIGERLREGLTIAVVGRPNVGKSSLVNAIADREVAIVTAVAGTTRDVIEVPLSIAGVPVTLLDTAGLRDSGDPVEAEGIRRARARAADADLVLHIVDAADPEAVTADDRTLVVRNKMDLAPSDGPLAVSAASGEGLDQLRAALAEWASSHARRAEASLITQRRHRAALIDCHQQLSAAERQDDTVLYAEHLRTAAEALGRLTGRTGTEDMLETLFARFCIGK